MAPNHVVTGKVIGDMIKQLVPHTEGNGSRSRYAQFAVKSLPVDANAGGIRPGGCNVLQSLMPTDMAIHVTGHEISTFSALGAYIDASHAKSIAGTLIFQDFAYPHIHVIRHYFLHFGSN